MPPLNLACAERPKSRRVLAGQEIMATKRRICGSGTTIFALAFVWAFISYSLLHSSLSSLSSLPKRHEDTDADAPSLLDDDSSTSTTAYSRHHPMDEAEFIIQKSYAESYARMHPCTDELAEQKCIAEVVKHLYSTDNTTTSTAAAATNQRRNPQHRFNVPPSHPHPWWFQTLLRDIPSNGAYGFWHHYSTISKFNKNPLGLRFCAIGKNGSQEWRSVFRKLNGPELCGDEGYGGIVNGSVCRSAWNTRKKLSEDPKLIPRTVFIRDPLERLLSGYLDKCVKPTPRIIEGHCEPNVVFGIDHLARQAKQGKGKEGEADLPDLTTVVQDRDKEMFALYVDVFPLKWNVHFVPQAIFCDLYRHIDSYDFVGVMGEKFMSELDRMARRYGGMLPKILNSTFNYQSNLQNLNLAGGLNNTGHETRASAKVAKYYSARAVRRALEYLSIDYIVLGLEVPEWAKEMLRSDRMV